MRETLKVWDLETEAFPTTLVGHTFLVVNTLAVLPDGRFASGSIVDGTIKLWDSVTCACLVDAGG